MDIQYTTVATPQDVHDILALQAQNHKSAVSEDIWASQGFVTVKHDFDLLWDMNRAYPSVIARYGTDLAGYCLMMHPSFQARIPILAPMFQRLAALSWNGRPLSTVQWFVMGQVCVAETYRGQRVMDGMYAHLRHVYRSDFELIITEVSERNPRSMRAHERVGFETLQAYTNADTGEGWRVIGLVMSV